VSFWRKPAIPDDPFIDAIWNLLGAGQGLINPKLSKTEAATVPASSLGHIDIVAQLFGLDFLYGRSDSVWKVADDVTPISLSQDIGIFVGTRRYLDQPC
jgi:hypothetical protein